MARGVRGRARAPRRARPIPDPRNRIGTWNGQRPESDPAEGIRATPLSSAPPQRTDEPSASGRDDEIPAVLWDILPGFSEWENAEVASAMIKNRPYSWWVENADQYRFAEQIELHYGIFEADGYWCRMPSASDRIHRPPPGYVGVYTRQLQYGLRFPLDVFVRDLLIHYNISLCQLTPTSIRRVMTYLWVCKFFKYVPNLHCFRKLHRLVPNIQSGHGSHGSGWYRIESRPPFLTMWPNDSSDKDWRGQWIWVRAPTDPGHPCVFSAPRYLAEPDPEMGSLGPPADNGPDPNLNQQNIFGKLPNRGGSGRMQHIPETWLPDTHYVFQENMLAAVGLSRKFKDGKLLRLGPRLLTTSFSSLALLFYAVPTYLS